MSPDVEPRRIGPYELVRPLGRGGSGEVWESLLLGPGGFKKPVALKLLRGAETQEARGWLLREARLGALLQHPNVVSTLGVTDAGGQIVVALELVRGASVAELLQAHAPLPPRVVLDVGAQAAAGLAHAHDLEQDGVATPLVHADVKPGNLLVDRSGTVKVADFGIASVGGDAGPRGGTRGYAAPEQLVGRATPATDLYALGATLVVMATGRKVPPTLEDADRDALAGQVDARVSGLGVVVRACLSAEPGDRPPSAQAVGDALAALLHLQPPGRSLRELVPGRQASTETPSLPPRTAPGNLRPPRDPFVGRRKELAELRAMLAEGPGCVVLLGPGGTGKTRLSLEAARSAASTTSGGCWAFDLTEARDADAICRVVAAGLSVQVARDDSVAHLGRTFADLGAALVLLDNLEQCVDALPPTLGRWLEMAPNTTFLTTSRRRTTLPGERVFAVDGMRRADAVALFADRLGRPLTDGERGDAEALVRALEGVPLSIELAAARAAVQGVAVLREHLSAAVLSGGRDEVPARQRSVEASLAWSASLASPIAREALSQLAVFEGGFTLEAANAVLRLSDATAAIDVLTELADASLLRVDGPRQRFSLLVVVREVATAWASAEARAAAELRHGRWYAEVGAPSAAAALRRDVVLRRALRPDLDNLVAAVRRAVARGDADCATAAFRAFWVLAALDGPFPFAADLSATILALPHLTGLRRARALDLAAAAARTARRVEVALAWWSEALDLAAEHGDRALEGAIAAHLGNLERECGHTDRARVHVDRAVPLTEAHGTAEQLAHARTIRGNLLVVVGKREDAQVEFEAALDLARQLGDRRLEAGALGNLGTVTVAVDEARRLTQAAVTAAAEVRDRHVEGILTGNLGGLYIALGDLAAAEHWSLRSLELHRRSGERRSEGIARMRLGRIRTLTGPMSAARDWLAEGARALREVDDARMESASLNDLSEVLRELGELDAAAEQVARALALARRVRDRRYEGWVVTSVGGLDLHQGRFALARSRFDTARLVGDDYDVVLAGVALRCLSVLGRALGDLVAARAAIDAALVRHHQDIDRSAWALSAGEHGLLCVLEGRPAEALEILSQVLRDLGRSGAKYREAQYDGVAAMAHAALGHRREAHAALERAAALLGDEVLPSRQQGLALCRLKVAHSLGDIADHAATLAWFDEVDVVPMYRPELQRSRSRLTLPPG